MPQAIESFNFFLNAMIESIPSFTVENFENFKYTQLENRILFLIAFSKCQQCEFDTAIKILLITLKQTLSKTRFDNNDKILISKLYFNLSYSFFKIEKDDEAIEYSNKGIKHCEEYHISYMLPNLYYRRGISKYHMKDPSHLDDLKAAVRLFI